MRERRQENERRIKTKLGQKRGQKEGKLGHARAVQNGEKGWQKIEKMGQ